MIVDSSRASASILSDDPRLRVTVAQCPPERKETQHTGQPTRREMRIALSFTAAVLFAFVLLNASLRINVIHDFVAIYTGASIVRQGHGSRLYDLAEQAHVQAPLFKGRSCAGCGRGTAAFWVGVGVALSKGRPFLVYNHTPFETLLFAPLTALSYGQAYVVWGAINIALWMFFAYLARPYAPVPEQTFHYLFLCFAFLPLWGALEHGQTSLLVLIAFTLTFIFLKRRQDLWAGMCLAFGLFKFPVVLPFALICLLRRKWKLMAGFTTASSVLAALSLIIVGPSGLLSYFRLLRDQVVHPHALGYGIKIRYMANVRGLIYEFLRHVATARSIDVAVMLVSVFLVVYAARGWNRLEGQGGAGSLGLGFAAALVISEVASFHTLAHDLSPTLLAILLAIGAYPWSNKPLWLQPLGVTVAGLYLVPLVIAETWYWLIAPVLMAFAIAALKSARNQPPQRREGRSQDPLAISAEIGETREHFAPL